MPTLIIDSGGTKAHWALITKGEQLTEGRLPAIHPFFVAQRELTERLELLRTALPLPLPDRIFFYGTGTSDPANVERLHNAFYDIFSGADVQIHSDLLAVARSLCGRAPGLAAILGTGSNVGRYDGRQLITTAGGLGYVLGDEGSGADLGKALLNHFLNGRLPSHIAQLLRERYELSRERIVAAVYRGEAPNRYLATFAPFLAEHVQEEAIDQLVQDRFRQFFIMNVLPLRGGDTSLKLSCSGSIAYHFRAVLQRVAADSGVVLGEITAGPMPGLIRYHQ